MNEIKISYGDDKLKMWYSVMGMVLSSTMSFLQSLKKNT